jgi:hypothetical protein
MHNDSKLIVPISYNTQEQVMRVLVHGGVPEAYHVPSDDLAKRDGVQKLHDRAPGLDIPTCGIDRAKATSTRRSTGVAALCMIETQIARDRFKRVVDIRSLDDVA